MMGTWFLASAYSSYVAAQIAAIATRPASEGAMGVAAGYTELFSQLLYIGLSGAVVLLVLSPLLKRMMHGVR
jgi:POT family proton-dependent oligopeptide transporter